MKFNLMQTGVIGRRYELEQGMAGQRPELYQRFLEEVKDYVRLADDLGYAGYAQPEHHLQIEGFEINNHPGMFVKVRRLPVREAGDDQSIKVGKDALPIAIACEAVGRGARWELTQQFARRGRGSHRQRLDALED